MIWNPQNPERKITQSLSWGAVRQERLSPVDTMFTNTGRRLYVIGDIDGGFRLRSNPYDLYAFGHPQADDPLANKLQGVWAQPVRGLSSYAWRAVLDQTLWDLVDADAFTQTFAAAAFHFRRDNVSARREDFVVADLPVLFSRLVLKNEGERSIDVKLIFHADFSLEDAWFTHLAARRNQGETVTVEEDHLVARAEILPDQWAAVVGMSPSPQSVDVLPDSAGELLQSIPLAPGAEVTCTAAVVVVSAGGAQVAEQILKQAWFDYEALRVEKQDLYDRLFARGPRLASPDPWLNAAFDLARANLQMLEAETDRLGRYFYAGLEMFPFWFSNDGAYSAPGLLASGMGETVLNHVRIGLHHQQAGRVPHQVSPAGHTAFAGNAQETPLWVLSIWDAYRWTGDYAFLAEMYPGAVRGLFEYTMGTIDPDGDGYPSGPGMVEVEGMGAEKLDSAVYTWAALRALAEMAEALQDAPTAARARDWQARIASHFEADWWCEAAGTYAMALGEAHQQEPAPHWAVITPLEVGLASSEHAAMTFAKLREQYLNEWGLKHTAGEDERVWTLPTAAFSRAAYRYQKAQMGYAMLRHVAETLEHGSIGLFHELIPQGACFLQLWSAATFVRGVIEDLMGISVRADRHLLWVSPQMPPDWSEAALEGLSLGGHTFNLRVTAEGVLEVNHLSGPAALRVIYSLAGSATRELLVSAGSQGRVDIG